MALLTHAFVSSFRLLKTMSMQLRHVSGYVCRPLGDLAFLLLSHRERATVSVGLQSPGEHLSGLVGFASRFDANRVHLASVGAEDCPPHLKPATQGGPRSQHSC